MIISCSWHGTTSARLWYSSCSYLKIYHKILCPLFQWCCILCMLLCREFSCCGIAALCVAGTVPARMNQQNIIEENIWCISSAWFFLVSLCCLDLVKEKRLDWLSKPQFYCLLTCLVCDSILLSHIKGRMWNLRECLWQQCQIWEGVLPHAVCFGYEQQSPKDTMLLHLVGICCW